LAEMVSLFDEARKLMREENHEIAICLECENRIVAITADVIETVEKLLETDIDALPEAMLTADNEYLSGIGKRKNTAELVQLLDIGRIIGTEESLIPDERG